MAVDVAELPDLVSALERAHIAVGWRAEAQPPGAALRPPRAARWGVNRMATVALSLPVRVPQCGFKAFRAPVAKLLFHLARDDGWAIDSEVLPSRAKIGFDTVEIPVRWTVPTGGRVRLHDAARSATNCCGRGPTPVPAG